MLAARTQPKPTHVDPEVGQVWSVSSQFGGFVEFRIDRIGRRPRGELRAYGKSMATGKCVSFLVSTLRDGRRGARLVKDATEELHVKRSALVEVGPTASDYRKETLPLHMPARDISLFETRVMQLKAKHWTHKLIATHLNCTEAKVVRAIEFVENVRAAKAVVEP
jgi:hypothetical protein